MYDVNYTVHDYNRDLQYKNKALQQRLDAFESGEIYVQMEARHKAEMAYANRENEKLRKEKAELHTALVTNRNNWITIIEELEIMHAKEIEELKRQHAKELAEKDRQIELANKRVNKYKSFYEIAYKARIMAKNLQYEAETKYEEQCEINKKLLAQINTDHENSSSPSSKDKKKKPITNNREKTTNNPGGQKGHPGHSRKRQEPTRTEHIATPKKFIDDPNYVKTDKVATRQVVGIKISLEVIEYLAELYWNKRTGKYVHADFPDGVDNDVNYDGSIRAFAFLLNNHCNVSIDKVSNFMKDITGGALKISKGMINGLSKSFSEKTKKEQSDIFKSLIVAPVINIDFTTANVNGKNYSVTICASPDTVGYYAKEHKGHEGIIDTPIELNNNTHIHDHDITFYNYGKFHQECLAHILRYLLDAIQYEEGLTWHALMRELIREMIHYRNSLGDKAKLTKEIVKDFEDRYDKILDIADKEYEYDPPSKYYKDGFNLAVRLRKYKEASFLFLHDKSVPSTNNLAERIARNFKMKMHQVMAFRSFESFEYLCHCLSVIATLQSQDANLFESTIKIFA